VLRIGCIAAFAARSLNPGKLFPLSKVF